MSRRRMEPLVPVTRNTDRVSDEPITHQGGPSEGRCEIHLGSNSAMLCHELAEPGQNANQIVSQIVLSAIAYADTGAVPKQ